MLVSVTLGNLTSVSVSFSEFVVFYISAYTCGFQMPPQLSKQACRNEIFCTVNSTSTILIYAEETSADKHTLPPRKEISPK
jgi:hypothetical protein